MSKLLLSGFMLVAILNVSACTSNSSVESNQNQTTLFGNTPMLTDDNVSLVTPTAGKATESMAPHSLQFMRIKHHKVECEGMQVTHCLLVQKEGSDQWGFLYEQIEGFDYQWGYEYELLVQVVDTDSGLSDVASHRYELVDLLSTTALDAQSTFTYTSRNTQERIVALDARTFTLLGQKDFTCSADSCENLRSAIAQNQSVVLAFEHGVRASEQLVLTAVLCSDAAQSFNGSCL